MSDFELEGMTDEQLRRVNKLIQGEMNARGGQGGGNREQHRDQHSNQQVIQQKPKNKQIPPQYQKGSINFNSLIWGINITILALLFLLAYIFYLDRLTRIYY